MLRVGLGRRTLINRMTVPNPSFLLSFADLGAGQVSTLEGANATAATFTRATAAWTKLSTGNWASVNSGVPRSFYTGMDTTVGIYAGYLAEGQRTNSALQSRAATSTVWIKTNITAAQDQVGIDGAANSASSLTATLANGTCFQTVVLASAAKAFSVFAKRVTGTGDVALTLDGGATYTTVTPSINASTFTQVQATQTVATATVGIKLVTSGDKIAVDMAQLEDGATFASTPIPTTTATATRNTDVLTYPGAGLVMPSVGSCYAEVIANHSVFSGAAAIVNFGSGLLFVPNAGVATQINMSDGTQQASKAGLSDVSTAIRKRASSWGIDQSITGDGASVGTNNFDGSMSGVNIDVGGGAASQAWYGAIKTLRIYQQQVSDSVLQQLTT